MTKPTIIGSECLNVCYANSTVDPTRDLAIIAEYNWYSDGTEGPNTRVVANYEIPFYVVKKPYRTYKDKHIVEDLSKCEKFMSNRAQLHIKAQRALGQKVDPKKRLAMVARSPYLYGADVSTPTVIKRRYKVKHPDYVGKGQRYIAALDIETNVNCPNKSENIISIAITMRENHYLFVHRPFVKRYHDPEPLIQKAYNKYLSEFEGVDKKGNPITRNLIKERKSNLHVVFCDEPHELVVEAYKVLHRLPLDFLAIFNVGFDIKKMMLALDKAGIDAKDVFCSPMVPEEFRQFNFKEDAIRKETSSGKSNGKHHASLWHVMEAPSRFYTICSMATYYKTRVTKADLRNYKLDTVLDEELGMRKLKFKEADHLELLPWHKFMQANYPIEYLIYNVFDCIALELLDEKTKDISQGIVFSTDCSEYARWGSGPKKLSDDLHYFALSNGQVLGTTSDRMITEFDKLVPTMNDWIAMLQSNLMLEPGIKLFKDAQHLPSNIYLNNYDEDVEAAYPSGEDIWNVGQETSKMELCSIEGRSEYIQRKTGIDLTAARTNALEISHNMFKAPRLNEVLDAFIAWEGYQDAA